LYFGRRPHSAVEWPWTGAGKETLLLLLLFILNPRENEGGENKKKIQRGLKWKKLVLVVLRGKTVVQQYGFKTLNGNINALKQ